MTDMKLPSLLHHLLNPDSRKVGFGWWLFITATWLLYDAKITAAEWQGCVMLSTALIGGGTIGDTWLKSKLGSGNAAPEKSDNASPPATAPTPG